MPEPYLAQHHEPRRRQENYESPHTTKNKQKKQKKKKRRPKSEPVRNYLSRRNLKYEDYWHFEQGLSDEEFLLVVIERFEKLNSHISYNLFQAEFLPRHRKPTFSDYVRFRKLEKMMLDE
jgi:hypothetical protein